MRFYTGKQFLDACRNNVSIAADGLWSRSKKIGCRVVRVATMKVYYSAIADDGVMSNTGLLFAANLSLIINSC